MHWRPNRDQTCIHLTLALEQIGLGGSGNPKKATHLGLPVWRHTLHLRLGPTSLQPRGCYGIFLADKQHLHVLPLHSFERKAGSPVKVMLDFQLCVKDATVLHAVVCCRSSATCGWRPGLNVASFEAETHGAETGQRVAETQGAMPLVFCH